MKKVILGVSALVLVVGSVFAAVSEKNKVADCCGQDAECCYVGSPCCAE